MRLEITARVFALAMPVIFASAPPAAAHAQGATYSAVALADVGQISGHATAKPEAVSEKVEPRGAPTAAPAPSQDTAVTTGVDGSDTVEKTRMPRRDIKQATADGPRVRSKPSLELYRNAVAMAERGKLRLPPSLAGLRW
jgi:hypothetical protein